jgi:hypothetical protein
MGKMEANCGVKFLLRHYNYLAMEMNFVSVFAVSDGRTDWILMEGQTGNEVARAYGANNARNSVHILFVLYTLWCSSSSYYRIIS